tara:strand:+ start:1210 stop:1374 length:165 start_codon:yes stop_codon:yes gene_type:complete
MTRTRKLLLAALAATTVALNPIVAGAADIEQVGRNAYLTALEWLAARNHLSDSL